MASSAYDVRLGGREHLSPRAILRLNAIVAVVLGSAILLLAGPAGGLARIGHRGVLATAGLVLLGFGSDELRIAVGRRLRRVHVWLFAVADVAFAATAVALTGGLALSILERSIMALVAIALVSFAYAEVRAAREL